MAVSEESSEYTIKWEAKPLGFSIVMDTTGRNAYVSSIQKQENLQKGLKLAAQIIKINGHNAKQKKHGEILELIKKATLPMLLTFQPRSFATGAGESENKSTETPVSLLFGGAPESARNRVDGIFTLCKDGDEEKKINGRNIWQRVDEESDPIILWYWPETHDNNSMKTSVWMISRGSQINTQNAYACVADTSENPLQINVAWKVFNKEARNFLECKLNICDAVDADSVQKY